MTRDASGVPQIAMMESDEYKSSRFALQTLDIPIQVRFRGSTAERYDFWRVYAGVTVSWVIKDYATLNNGAFKVRYYNLPYLQNWLFTANLQVGYGKFTLRADYTLNPLFRSSRTGDIPGLGDTRSISLGLPGLYPVNRRTPCHDTPRKQNARMDDRNPLGSYARRGTAGHPASASLPHPPRRRKAETSLPCLFC